VNNAQDNSEEGAEAVTGATPEDVVGAAPEDGAGPAPEAMVSKILDAAVRAIPGTRRPGQEQMAQEVSRALREGRHLLVQAGTGTGKSLAYLVPALVHAVTRDQVVVVATATLALQRQITKHDLPKVLEAAGETLGRRPTQALLKGRGNYLCLNKTSPSGFDDPGAAEPLVTRSEATGSMTGSRLAAEARAVTEWAGRTTNGDRDDLPDGVSQTTWRRFSVGARECLGDKCAFVDECFAERARAAVAEADLVVTNHAMLALQTTGLPMLPEHSALIVDEAHQLVDSITSALTGVLNSGAIRRAANAVRQLEQTAELEAQARVLEKAAVALDVALGLALGTQARGASAGRPEQALRQPGGLSGDLALAVSAVEAATREALSAVGQERDAAPAPKKAAEAALHELRDLCRRLTPSGDQAAEPAGSDVIWLSREPDGDPQIRVAPLDVSQSLGQGLFSEVTGVLTSATLTPGGQAEPIARDCGLRPGLWDHREVDSPFNYGEQAILYIAADLPAPGRETGHRPLQHRRLAELINAAGGGALGLFTSHAAAREAAVALRQELDFPILLQEEGNVPGLVERFLKDPATCLFGVTSLWQGIDAPGSTCRLVTIDRLPFPRPDDPLVKARTELAERSGLNGFMTVSLAHAALMLAQGAGRLIRSREDQGVVAVLDSRLATARYGGFVIKSLPPFWRTTDLAAATGALRRTRPGQLGGGAPMGPPGPREVVGSQGIGDAAITDETKEGL
jgi:ATP-dependent DNA helicase DinG